MSDMKKILGKLTKMSIKTKKDNLSILLVFLLLIFLCINVFFSQTISQIFFGMTINDNKSVVQFLQKVRDTKYFDQQLKYFENIYGPSLKTDVFAKERIRKAKIKQLEQILEKNSQSRDVLYSLFQLYWEENDKLTALKYLQLAKTVDPNVE